MDRLLDDVATRANRHAIFYLIRPYLADPDDEFILELASASAYIDTHKGMDCPASGDGQRQLRLTSHQRQTHRMNH